MGHPLTHTVTHTPIAHNGHGGFLSVQRPQKREVLKIQNILAKNFSVTSGCRIQCLYPSPIAHYRRLERFFVYFVLLDTVRR